MVVLREYIPMDEFPLRWRFAEDATRWTVLPETDLRQLQPLSESSSREQWRKLVSPAATHLMALGEFEPRFESRVAELKTNDQWSNEEEATRVAEFLRQRLPIRDAAHVLFFWDASLAAETTWDVLLRYWSDFCYPSDDSNVVVPSEGNRLVVYVEGLVWIIPRDNRAGEDGRITAI